MKLVLLDADTLGDDLDLNSFRRFGDLDIYSNTAASEVADRVAHADVLLLNKVRLNAENLKKATQLRLICVSATGFDNVDLDFCRKQGIAVCNVVGYSTQCVAQVTVTMALSLITHLHEYTQIVANGSYSSGVTANRVSPAYHEIAGKTWGIVGFGNIGKQVGNVAKSLGCNVLVCKRTPIPDWNCVFLDYICREADILSIHTPLNDSTRNLIDEKHIAMMKPDAILINVARGAVTDEKALARAIQEGKLGGLGVDVFSTEPFRNDHPFYEIREYPNVCMTPHMAWGGYETRVRLINEMCENISAFLSGKQRNRVD